MTTSAVARRAQELAGQRAPFVTATVVRAQRPTSARPGDVALVLPDGTIEGFVGGMCAQQTVRVYALQSLDTGEALLLRILPDGSTADPDDQGREVASEEGAVTVQNTCLSGGAIEVFLDPVLPDPRVLVAGDTPAANAIHSLGEQLGLELVEVDAQGPEPASGDLALVVATHGRDELHALRRALEEDVPYVGLVASRKRGAGVLDELRADGVAEDDLARIDVPAGIDIGGRTPAEIALSVLAAIVAVRRGRRAAAPAVGAMPARATEPRTDAPRIAVDPICGMTVAVVAGTPMVELDGETSYFCCEGCATKFGAEHELSASAE